MIVLVLDPVLSNTRNPFWSSKLTRDLPARCDRPVFLSLMLLLLCLVLPYPLGRNVGRDRSFMLLNRGRSAENEAAVIARPGSIIDNKPASIACSKKRESTDNPPRYGMRIMDAMLPRQPTMTSY